MLHTLLSNASMQEARFQNAFIDELGERFDSLKHNQLCSFINNMAKAGLNQEDIMNAVVEKIMFR